MLLSTNNFWREYRPSWSGLPTFVSHPCVSGLLTPLYQVKGNNVCMCAVCAFLDTCVVVYQLQLLNTWGDPYYVGLNGLQLFDDAGWQIHLTSNRIPPYPDVCMCVCV